MAKVSCPLPQQADLIAGHLYWWCACGKSLTAPFCDGKSHRNTKIEPVVFQAQHTETRNLCGCQQCLAAPQCDVE